MLNGFFPIPVSQPARFSGTATIQIFFDSPLINTANVVRAWIIDALNADGWQVQGVTPLGGVRFLATVTGSTSDNMDAVRTAFIRSLNNHGIALDDVTAGFVGSYQPPTNTTPPINTTPPSGTPVFAGFTYVRQNGSYALYKENNTNDCYQLEGAELVYWGDCSKANSTLTSLNTFLADLGSKLGFSATSALIGGALASGIVLIYVLKQQK